MKKQYDEAIAYFDKALQINPKLMDVFTNKVLTLAAQKKWDAAREACTQQLAVVADSQPARAIVHFMEGQIHKARGDLKAAESAFQKALEANANYVLAYYELARLYLREKDVDSAVAQFETLLEKNPKQFGVHMQLGTIHDLNGRPDLAETHYRKALEINPDFAPAANNLAYNLAEQRKSLDEALTLAQKAREKLPDDPGVMDTLGWVYARKGLWDSAIRELQDSLAKMPDNAAIHYHLGVAYAGKGDKENARMAFNKALETKGAEAVAEQVKEAMGKL
jgi:tetratricopeptide (TPR) repeat protein